jgi:hypothetical protein
MNKSTPLNQLPSGPLGQNTFVNDQQRQIVTNAQAAINTMQMPQNTQQTFDVGNDEEAEIQEALNDVNAQLHRQPTPQMQMPPPPMPVQHQQQMQQSMNGYVQQMPNIPIENQADLMFMQNGGQAPPPSMHMPMPPVPKFDISEPQTVKQIIIRFADDLKLGAAIIGVIFALHFVPIESIVGKYFAIEKIPHHQILIRAVLAAAIIIIIKNVVINKMI